MSLRTGKFVKMAKMAEIRWKSADPDYVRRPQDIFDLQDIGIPDSLGKKDKTTTEQAVFACLICDCELSSIKTFADHCQGTQHQRSELAKMKEVFQLQRRQDRGLNEEASKQPLKDIVRDIRYPVIGYEDLIEFKPPCDKDPYLYKCKLCRNDIYRSADMADHLLTTVHQRRYFEVKYSNVPDSRDELVSEVQNEFDNVGEGPDVIQVIDDPRQYKDASRRIKKYEGIRKASGRRFAGEKRSRSPESKAGLVGGGEDELLLAIPELPPHLRPIHDRPQVDLSLVAADEISDLADGQDIDSKGGIIGGGGDVSVPLPPQKVPKVENDPVTMFHREVAKSVKQSLDKYYFPQEGQPNERRIADGVEYGSLAKAFSHQLREEEKDVHARKKSSLTTISMTPEIMSRIKDRIDLEMGKKPILE